MKIDTHSIRFINDRLRFVLNRIREKLWVKPLLMCVLAIGGAFLAKAADYTIMKYLVPEISVDSIENLLNIMATSMLIIATFAVQSMVSAYASASRQATPRSFKLVVADDRSQNALSAFIGAFIFSIVSLIAVQNSYYNTAGRFTLFALTLLVFMIVILTFVRWVDRVARLGRMQNTIEKVESATAAALKRRKSMPTLCGVAVSPQHGERFPVYDDRIGYVQQINMDDLQTVAEETQTHIEVAALPGQLIAPGQPLAHVTTSAGSPANIDSGKIAQTFLIGSERTFDEDPRFGLVVLSQIASRALSPGVNDPGTAIDVLAAQVRLLAEWSKPVPEEEQKPVRHDLIAVPALSVQEMFDDAFNPISRDGASLIEVVIRLQKALAALAAIPDPAMQQAARQHARSALARAEQALDFPEDIAAARRAAGFMH